MHPVPGYPISTPYGRRGAHWSCNEDSSGNGVHTGADIAAPAGTPVLACRPGVVVHVDYGSAFGEHQLAVRCDDGSEDFYAHMAEWSPAGVDVKAGDRIGVVGYEGNVAPPGPAGAHLHLERHPKVGQWACSNHENPQPSIDYQEDFVLDAATADQIRAIVREETLGVVRADGISGASDAALMRTRYTQVGGMPVDVQTVASALRSDGVSGAADAALMRGKWEQVGGVPATPAGVMARSSLSAVVLLLAIANLGSLILALAVIARVAEVTP